MKKMIVLLVAVLASLTSISPSRAEAAGSGDPPTVASLNAEASRTLSDGQWKRFSKNLVAALATDHAGVKSAAMRHIIQYANNLDVSEAVFDVMRIYRDDSDVNRRRMAVVALGSMKSEWALLFLERSAQFESSEVVAKTIQAVLKSKGA